MEKLSTTWNGIFIEIVYKQNYLNGSTIDGRQLAHLDVYTEEPIPITETGYSSIFLSNGEVTEAGGAISLVKSLLDKGANSKEWVEYEKSQQQMNLF